ncbi:undecaprenyl-phosphate glucose phosphotransferase [Ignavibacterium sp.]|uniref:undecaprenyl-phosphate glucose phosphotransferase n=1 Tax=Ignavibacterium sp. TaxID=2651167 RepID=UPI0022026732|nr:undecaprenyl-phosphate glucose phosphotransferase [Ignavibacterium sp.]BDQ04198.1 MAG: undecaprenyl-phosphate glucose phosphotransferase [Ignavibacterium sp.]
MSKKLEKFLLVFTDFIMINLAFIVYFALRVQSGLFDLVIMPEFFLPMIALYFYWLLIFTFVGMYRSWFAASRFDEISTLFKATFVGIFILFFIIFLDDYLNNVSSSTRILIFIYWALLVAFVGTGRVVIRSIQRNLLIKGFGRRNALIVGFNERAFEVLDTLFKAPALGIDVKAFVTIKDEHLNKSYNNIKVESNLNSLAEIINKYNVQEIILALEKDEHDSLVDIISLCSDKNIKIKIVPDLYEILSGQARTSQIYGMPLIDIMPELMPEWERKLKRLLDIVVSIIILLVSLPVTLITALAIKLDSEGPVFFTQERMGMNGKIFKMIKFRSMRKDAEKLTGPVWSQKNDPRVTRVGKIIRKLRIDEIPQFINVLKGDMSVVGPRPERPYFVEKLSQEIPYYKRRLKVRPGITGWAQVKHKYDESIEDVKIKLRYDLFYIENMSIRMDLKILFRTIFVVLFGKGHYE